MEFFKMNIKGASLDTFILALMVLMAYIVSIETGDVDIVLKSNGVTYVDRTQKMPFNQHQRHSRVKRSARISQADANILVDLHNAKRRLEPASDMEFMTWNQDLANMAQLWGDHCVWEHGQRSYSNPPYSQIGQNLFITSGKLDYQKAMIGWSDNEKIHYNYDTTTCAKNEMCGHYTQVVWATSREVGCAYSFCPTVRGLVFGNAEYLVCNYGPAGNYANTKPFRIGPACTECDSGKMWCSDGLCRRDCNHGKPNCQCNAQCANNGCPTSDCGCQCQDGYRGTSCTDNCQNLHEYCGSSPGWPDYWCDEEHQFVLDYCPLLCGVCQAPSSRILPCSNIPTTALEEQTTRWVTPTQPVVADCDKYDCRNGGQARPVNQICSCSCPNAWMGATCQESRAEARIGIMLLTSTSSDHWRQLSQDLRDVIANILNSYCQQHEEDCCNGQTLTDSDAFAFIGNVFVGNTYPNYVDFPNKRVTRVLIFARSTTRQGNCDSELPQDVLYSALHPVRGTLDLAIRACCDSMLHELQKAVEEPLPTDYTSTQMASELQTSEKPPVLMDGSNGSAIPVWLIVFIAVLIIGIFSSAGILVYFIKCRTKSRKVAEVDQNKY